MLPADVTGFYAYTIAGEATFNPGPVFANVVLADELNRTTPRTQAALLEAMQEHQVTIERETHPLPSPFMVVASQLGYGAEGTYPLTEVQVDRFMFRLWCGYPDTREEEEVIRRIDYLDVPDAKIVATTEEIAVLQRAARGVYVSPEVVQYMVALVSQIRGDEDVLMGPSPRASIALYKGSRALALLDGRDFVLPDDVKRLATPSLAHRIRLKAEAEVEDVTPVPIVERALEGVPVPKVEW
jgi:MoxR-like ATPase